MNAIIVQALYNDPIIKNADNVLSGLPEKIKEYFGSKFDSDNKAASVISMLAPGTLFMLLSAHPFLRILLPVAAGTFQIEIKDMIASMLNSIKPSLTSGKQVTPAEVDQAAETAASQQTTAAPAATEEQDDMGLVYDKEAQAKNDRRLKLALLAYHNDNSAFQFSKYAKTAVTPVIMKSFLSRILSWVFKLILASAGFLLVGDLIKEKILNKPNSLSGGIQNGKEVGTTVNTQPLVVSTQTKFKLRNPGKIESPNTSWEIAMPSNQSAIEQMLINFAKETYLGLDNADSAIRSTIGFNFAVKRILAENRASAGYNVVIMPAIFTTKKQIVDTFIDEVANILG